MGQTARIDIGRVLMKLKGLCSNVSICLIFSFIKYALNHSSSIKPTCKVVSYTLLLTLLIRNLKVELPMTVFSWRAHRLSIAGCQFDFQKWQFTFTKLSLLISYWLLNDHNNCGSFSLP